MAARDAVSRISDEIRSCGACLRSPSEASRSVAPSFSSASNGTATEDPLPRSGFRNCLAVRSVVVLSTSHAPQSPMLAPTIRVPMTVASAIAH